jgi:hypothetical protein
MHASAVGISRADRLNVVLHHSMNRQPSIADRGATTTLEDPPDIDHEVVNYSACYCANHDDASVHHRQHAQGLRRHVEAHPDTVERAGPLITTRAVCKTRSHVRTSPDWSALLSLRDVCYD